MKPTLPTPHRSTVGRILAAFVAKLYRDANNGQPEDVEAVARTILLANVDLGCMTTVDGDALFGALLDLAHETQAKREGGAR